LDISFICWFKVIRVLFCVDGIGDKGSDDTTVDVQMLVEAFLNLSPRCACLIGDSSGKEQNLRSWNYSPQVARLS
jgi:hypothetical protein